MNARTGHMRRRDQLGRRSSWLRGAIVSGAVLGSLALAGGLTGQAVSASPVPSPGTDAGDHGGFWVDHVVPLVRPSHAPQSHATTHGS